MEVNALLGAGPSSNSATPCFDPAHTVLAEEHARHPQAPLMEPLVLVNPEVVWTSEGREKGWEGCLSIPGLRGLVPRVLDLEGFPARIFQHELDHLDGLVFFDRVADNRDLISETEYLLQVT